PGTTAVEWIIAVAGREVRSYGVNRIGHGGLGSQLRSEEYRFRDDLNLIETLIGYSKVGGSGG
ncbi:MAG: hypothetical protein ACRDUT_15640, partial [Mycobacterium sp.]